MRTVFLDTETTGLHPDQGDRIIEIGCIEYGSRQPTGRNLHHYINPGRPSHPDALRVHGITDAFLANKPTFGSVADELVAYLAGAEVVIHNADFDIRFLDSELHRLDRPGLFRTVASVTDSLRMARAQFPGKANSLDALCRRFEVSNTHRKLHGALLDAELLGEVYVRLTRGQDVLVLSGEDPGLQVLAEGMSDLSDFDLPMIHATAEELAAHEAYLDDLEKSIKGPCVWRGQTLAHG